MIDAYLNNQVMTLRYLDIISDSVRFLKIAFHFDEYWDGMDKTAVFEHDGEKYLVPLFEGSSMYLGDDTCYVPQEVIKSKAFFVSVFGTKDNTIITSSNEPVSVSMSGFSEHIPVDPTPSAWTQMLSIAENTQMLANDVKARGERGEYAGPGVIAGGNKGQVLRKVSNKDYDADWYTMPDSYSKTESDNKYATKDYVENHHDDEKQNVFAEVAFDDDGTNWEFTLDKDGVARMYTGSIHFKNTCPKSDESPIDNKDLTNKEYVDNHHDNSKQDKLTYKQMAAVDSGISEHSWNEVYLGFDNKQDKLTAGENITIDQNNVISAKGGKEEAPYELIEKIIVGYSLTESKPTDWETNYTSYFINVGTNISPIYQSVTGGTAPIWENNKYYSYNADGITSIVRKNEPNGTFYNFKKMIVVYKKLTTNDGSLANFYFSTDRNGADAKSIYFLCTGAVKNQYGKNTILADVDNQVLKVLNNAEVGGNASCFIHTKNNMVLNQSSIKNFQFYRVSGSIIRSGNTIEIYGVRA